MSVELETEINVKERIKEVIQDPGKYKVIFANDNETPMDFVVDLLVDVFRHSPEDSDGQVQAKLASEEREDKDSA